MMTMMVERIRKRHGLLFCASPRGRGAVDAPWLLAFRALLKEPVRAGVLYTSRRPEFAEIDTPCSVTAPAT